MKLRQILRKNGLEAKYWERMDLRRKKQDWEGEEKKGLRLRRHRVDTKTQEGEITHRHFRMIKGELIDRPKGPKARDYPQAIEKD